MSFVGQEIEGGSSEYFLIIDNETGVGRLEKQSSTINLKATQRVSRPSKRDGDTFHPSATATTKLIKPS